VKLVNIEEFISANACRVLYHISEKGSWPSIQKLGLFSTSALLDQCGVTGTKRFRLESELRISKETIKHPIYGDINLRDQDPMRDRPSDGIKLANLLTPGTTVQQWFEFLNGKTFFWVSKKEFLKMLCARLYRGKPHWVITLDTHSLLGAYSHVVSVSDQNSGSLYSKKLRGPSTFVPLLTCPTENKILELTIDDGVPDIEKFTLSVDECIGSWQNDERICKKVKHIWP
jgi:hypothetical protein